MKIVALNTWGGRAGKDKLLEFFARHKDVDVFCLQEIWAAPYEHLDGHMAGGRPMDHTQIMVYGLQDITAAMPEYEVYFHPHHADNYGLVLLVRRGLAVTNVGELFVYKHKGHVPEGDIGNHARNIQHATIMHDGKQITVVNFHGLWNGKGKGDSEDRLVQSDAIINFLKGLTTPYVLCGDFNLLPDTKSILKFETFGARNLIKEYGITSTRPRLYDKYDKAEQFADYAFVSNDVSVRGFSILPDEVSDHAPLYLDIE